VKEEEGEKSTRWSSFNLGDVGHEKDVFEEFAQGSGVRGLGEGSEGRKRAQPATTFTSAGARLRGGGNCRRWEKPASDAWGGEKTRSTSSHSIKSGGVGEKWIPDERTREGGDMSGAVITGRGNTETIARDRSRRERNPKMDKY